MSKNMDKFIKCKKIVDSINGICDEGKNGINRLLSELLNIDNKEYLYSQIKIGEEIHLAHKIKDRVGDKNCYNYNQEVQLIKLPDQTINLLDTKNGQVLLDENSKDLKDLNKKYGKVYNIWVPRLQISIDDRDKEE